MIDKADVVVGLAWGDEAKGKITSQLASTKKIDGSPYYSMVARWAGGNNAGHTVYLNGKMYKTHIIPSGVFYGIKSLVGPGCVLNVKSFCDELDYLADSGFDTSLVKVAPNCHIVTEDHIDFDKEFLAKKLGTTGRGIAPCYADKAARTGRLAFDVLDKEYIWNEELSGNLLCEGAQGIWLDIDHGLYPYVTSSITLPYGACSIGFPTQKIDKIWGAAKIYDTRSGEDPRFPARLLENPTLKALADLGKEFGVTTGRRRKVNWLNLDMLIKAVNMTGTTNLVISKCDVIRRLGQFKISYGGKLVGFLSFDDMISFIEDNIRERSPFVKSIDFSYSPEVI
jgi:adenylosuccinate synthase